MISATNTALGTYTGIFLNARMQFSFIITRLDAAQSLNICILCCFFGNCDFLISAGMHVFQMVLIDCWW